MDSHTGEMPWMVKLTGSTEAAGRAKPAANTKPVARGEVVCCLADIDADFSEDAQVATGKKELFRRQINGGPVGTGKDGGDLPLKADFLSGKMTYMGGVARRLERQVVKA